VLVYSRAACGLCWVCRFQFWMAGLDYEVKSIDTDKTWGEALDRNGYKGGTFKLPVVVHKEKAWWDITDHAGLAEELKGRLLADPAPAAQPVVPSAKYT